MKWNIFPKVPWHGGCIAPQAACLGLLNNCKQPPRLVDPLLLLLRTHSRWGWQNFWLSSWPSCWRWVLSTWFGSQSKLTISFPLAVDRLTVDMTWVTRFVLLYRARTQILFTWTDRQLFHYNGQWRPQFDWTTNAGFYVSWHGYLFHVKFLVVFCMVGFKQITLFQSPRCYMLSNNLVLSHPVGSEQ